VILQFEPSHARHAHVEQEAARLAAVGGQEGFGVGEGTRLDFCLDDHPKDARSCFVEVKSVTMEDEGVARFPDAVTTRGRRHLETLARLHAEGHRSVLLYIVQRVDCDRVAPADEIDPEYSRTLREVVARGVEVIAVQARVSARSIRLE